MGTEKEPLLFLCHRIPYPPDKGDKIRSYHLLKYLCEHYRVFLAAFVDDDNDWQYTSVVEGLCEDSCLVKLDPFRAKIRSLKGFFSGRPLSLPYYENSGLSGWVSQQRKQHKIERVVAYSSPMAQYVMADGASPTRKIIDFVDIDSDKWRQYEAKKHWPLSWVYRRESRTLLAVEKSIAKVFDASLFVSSAEADLFRQLAPEVKGKVDFYNNGVDTAYFSPDTELLNPYPDGARVLVFTGAMDYWPNVDAVEWFASDIFPRLLEKHPEIRFYIVGSKPTDAVLQLGKKPGVVVTGRVEDVRPYLKYALAAVAPMRIARGIQNKVLEAMAMAKTTLVTGPGLEGILAEHGKHVVLADTESELIQFAEKIINGEYVEIGPQARLKVMNDFNWAENLPLVGELLESSVRTQG
ncbi:MAG: TIGR03087 family PEP-CTERM/XrtA system glycosyltransferase [Porticoccaceae bacterium]|nr:TIGR03087 family PEP-CTERM/XrtA system glycosyltransferase [Pseudomonadales bacterium]MCP5172685.1 TIGR03087 family PEP-CTERM/XrtA system glycosyltransferase [Pseudomonadales bacterium]MCP5302159.1 TIGR03087 family PEP-CTERM/XrtA system glycosyltransferase [Pseudomonadales bacterium]